MKIKNLFVFIIFSLLTLLTANPLHAQSKQNHKKHLRKKTIVTKPKVGQASASPHTPLQCTVKNTEDEKITYLVGASNVSSEETKRIKEKWGVLTVPKGETERAKDIRKNALAYRRSVLDRLTKSFENWVNAHPNATVEETEKRRTDGQAIIAYFTNNKVNEERVVLSKWDWRDYNIDVCAVMNQGAGCNTCWAFASISAAASSLQKNYVDQSVPSDYMFPDATTGELSNRLGPVFFMESVPSPFAQDLLNCMPIKKEDICQSGWHGNAFDFMVYKKGIPMTYTNGIPNGENITNLRKYERGQKFACPPDSGFVKASS